LVGLGLFAGCGRSSVRAALARDCNDGADCFKQARALLEGGVDLHPEEVRARAAVLYQKGCDLGSADSCAELGSWLEDSELTPRDLPRAAGLHEKGCALKSALACYSLAHLYHDGRGVPLDRVRAAKYRKLACGLADSTTREDLCK
jgi:uncharacterized protein